MQTTKKISAVREAVIKAVPYIKTDMHCGYQGSEDHSCSVRCLIDTRPIRLADVLLAIRRKEETETKNLRERLDKFGGRSAGVEYPLFYNAIMAIAHHSVNGGEFWKLDQDDLSQQSPECIDFLHSLLIR